MTSLLKNYTLDGFETRVFSDDKLQAAIERAFNALPPDKTVAAIAHADLVGTSLSIVARVPGTDKVTIMAAAYKSWHGQLKAEAEVRFAL